MNEAENGANPRLTLEIEGKIGEMRANLDELPDLEYLDNLSLDPDPAIFMETLILCIKNNALLEQKRLSKLGNSKQNSLITEIKNFKKDNLGNVNAASIQRKERELSVLIELGLKKELENLKKFETLNDERIMPHFMSLAKNITKSETPTLIKDDNGSAFENLRDLGNYVEQYYKSIYIKNRNVIETRGTEQIENFLGEEIVNRDEIRNAKLNEEEKTDLDKNLTLEELEQSISKANLKSAPGSNGLSNRFIRSFWDFLKRPLLRYSNHAFATGKLSDSFRTADIKLIPKKGGDLSKIKNWRPISLLNCFYKCISRAFATRLKKYMNKLTPCCQKGYANGRYCQEVLISVIDTIEKCRHLNKKGGVLCLDIKKAFDSLSHSYLKNIFEFYNFSPNISRWLTVLSLNRAARIVLLNDVSTNFFELEQGNAQGDTISPFLFNLGYQILLFKLEYDNQIHGLIDAVYISEALLPLPINVSQVPPRTYALADDATVLTSMDPTNLRRIRDLLIEFKMISGLVCNVEKTTPMQIGSNDPVSREVVDLGFDIQEEVKLLGLKIKKNCNYYLESVNDIENKIRNQIRFWGRFDLSLPGRVSIAKTFLYSQINYLGCFLPISEEKINMFETLIEDYVRGPLNISQDRMTLTREEGGVGLFKISIYLAGQICTWAKRAQSLDDNWKLRLYAKSYGSALNIRSGKFDPVTEPIISNIAKNFTIFIGKLSTTKRNIKESYVLENDAVTFEGENGGRITEEFFGDDDFNGQMRKIGNLKVSDIIKDDGEIVSYKVFSERTNIRIREAKYETLSRICANLVEEAGNFAGIKPVDLTTFCNRFRKGSKSYRRIISGPRIETIPRNMQTFADCTDTIIGLSLSEKINGLWGHSFFNNDVQSFLFKLHGNVLGINSRVAHFIRDHSPVCTFCRLRRRDDAEDETILHLFFSCPETEEFKNQFFIWAFDTDNQFSISRSELFHVFTDNDFITGTCLTKTAITKLYLKYIWDCRNRQSLPNLEEAKIQLKASLKNIANVNSKMKTYILDSGLGFLLMQG